MFDKEAVLYKEKINYKYPNTGLYRAHQILQHILIQKII